MPSNIWLTSIVDPAICAQVAEMAGSPSEVADNDKGITAVVTLKVPWAIRNNIIADILNNALSYPRSGGDGAPSAATISCVPFSPKVQMGGDYGEWTTYDEAQLTINFNQDVKKDSSDGGATFDIFSESLEPNAEFISQNPKDFVWGSPSSTDPKDKVTNEEAPGKLVIGFDYIQTRFRLDEIPNIVLRPGQVNSNQISSRLLGLDFPAETLLYQNSQPSRSLNSDGTGQWTMASRFSYREHSWNKIWRPNKQAWERMYIKNGPPFNNYPPGDLSSILV